MISVFCHGSKPIPETGGVAAKSHGWPPRWSFEGSLTLKKTWFKRCWDIHKLLAKSWFLSCNCLFWEVNLLFLLVFGNQVTLIFSAQETLINMQSKYSVDAQHIKLGTSLWPIKIYWFCSSHWIDMLVILQVYGSGVVFVTQYCSESQARDLPSVIHGLDLIMLVALSGSWTKAYYSHSML